MIAQGVVSITVRLFTCHMKALMVESVQSYTYLLTFDSAVLEAFLLHRCLSEQADIEAPKSAFRKEGLTSGRRTSLRVNSKTGGRDVEADRLR